MADRTKNADDNSDQAPTAPETVLSMLSKVVSGLILGYVVYMYMPISVPKDGASVYDNVVYALRWQSFTGLTLIFSVMRVGRARITTKGGLDPLSKEGQAGIEPYSRRLQNTLEQLIINVIGQLILSTYLQPATLRLIPALVFLFVFARIMFYAGYPERRGAGFILTFFPTLAVYLANMFFLITSGPMFRL